MAGKVCLHTASLVRFIPHPFEAKDDERTVGISLHVIDDVLLEVFSGASCKGDAGKLQIPTTIGLTVQCTSHVREMVIGDGKGVSV